MSSALVVQQYNIYFIWIVDADSILALKGTAANVVLLFFGQKVAEKIIVVFISAP